MSSFIKKILIFSAVLLIPGIGVMLYTGNAGMIAPFLVGWGLSLANSVAGVIVIERAFSNSGKGFFNTVLLSMVVRMFIILGAFAALIMLLKVDKINLAVSLFLFYFLFLLLEVNYLQARQKRNDLIAHNK